jgi:hypothetical protein
MRINRAFEVLLIMNIAWPALPKETQAGLAETYPPDQLERNLATAARKHGAVAVLIQGMRSGALPVWAAAEDGSEMVVDPSAFLELEWQSILAACYRPFNDRGWLYGRPLFVKIADLEAFAAALPRTEKPSGDRHAVEWIKAYVGPLNVNTAYERYHARNPAGVKRTAFREDWKKIHPKGRGPRSRKTAN